MPERGPSFVRLWAFLPAVLLCIAVYPYCPYALYKLPGAYYELLRIVVRICGLIAARVKYQENTPDTPWGWLFTAAALVFNPVLPLKMTSHAWLGADLLTACAFLALALTD